MIFILEDNNDRVRAFRDVLARLNPSLRLLVWNSAHVMIRELGEHLAAAKLLSLDHDLYVPAGSDDPGDGLDVAKFLVTQEPIRPIIVHSSNSNCASQMMGEFELAGWPATRVLPLGDSWIEDDWQLTVRECLSR